jgi:uncharacterized protein (DUF305 family)
MKIRALFTAVAVVAIIGAAIAAENTSQIKTSAAAHAGHSMSSASNNPVIASYQEINDKMHEHMAIEFTGNADLDFMRGMIPHHQGAIDMARIAIKYGKDPEVRKLAEDVISAQEEERKFMNEWLK